MKHDVHNDAGQPKGPHHKGHRRGGRHRRLFDYGDLRLLILAMIETRPRHGYELIKDISDRFDGRYSPSPGVIYPTLSWLEDMGYVTISAENGGRKLSQITAEGTAFLVANRRTADELLKRELPPERPDHIPASVVAGMDLIKSALRERLSGAETDAEEVARLAAVLEEAARKIRGTE